MHKALFALAGFLAFAPVVLCADIIEMPEGEPTPELVLPAKGLTMAEVEKKYGEPRTKHAAVGGGSPQHPPITRWDYDGFVVVFEKERVIDAVIPGAPPKLHHRDELKPTEQTPPPEAPAPEPAEPEPLPGP